MKTSILFFAILLLIHCVIASDRPKESAAEYFRRPFYLLRNKRQQPVPKRKSSKQSKANRSPFAQTGKEEELGAEVEVDSDMEEKPRGKRRKTGKPRKYQSDEKQNGFAYKLQHNEFVDMDTFNSYNRPPPPLKDEYGRSLSFTCRPNSTETDDNSEFNPHSDMPAYWDMTGRGRLVSIATFSLIRPNPAPNRHIPKILSHIEPTHTEVHVGGTAFSLAALRDKWQRIESRPVEMSGLFIGKIVKEQSIQMCQTTRTDLEIYDYIQVNFRGIFSLMEFNCHAFSEFLTKFLCPNAPFPEKLHNCARFGMWAYNLYSNERKNIKPLKLLKPIFDSNHFTSGETDASKPWPWLDVWKHAVCEKSSKLHDIAVNLFKEGETFSDSPADFDKILPAEPVDYTQDGKFQFNSDESEYSAEYSLL